MVDIYCLKCRIKTSTNNVEHIVTKNSRNMIKGTCTICGSKKSQFVGSSTTGKGLSLNNLVNNLPLELHLFADKGENVPNGSFNNQQKYSYCGPGTKYKQRLREGYKGINELDSMCKLHDQFYNENTDTKTRNISDIALAHRADEIARNPMYDAAQRKDANIISGIMSTKAKLGFGVSKNLKRRRGMKN